jgi:hypothetical protein
MSNRGVAFFDPAFVLPSSQVWLDGAYLAVAGKRPWDRDEAPVGTVLQMHDGSNIVSVVYRGDKAPDAYDKRNITITALAADEGDYWAIRKAKAKGTAVWYADGIRVGDVFTATDTETYTLSRRRAKGLVTGVDETGYPTRIYLDGVLDGTAATIGADEQTVTAADTGEIEIRYTAAFKVFVVEMSERQAAHNQVEMTLTLEEVITGDFT